MSHSNLSAAQFSVGDVVYNKKGRAEKTGKIVEIIGDKCRISWKEGKYPSTHLTQLNTLKKAESSYIVKREKKQIEKEIIDARKADEKAAATGISWATYNKFALTEEQAQFLLHDAKCEAYNFEKTPESQVYIAPFIATFSSLNLT